METTTQEQSSTLVLIRRILSVVLVLFVFLISLKLMGGGFKLLGKDFAEQMINITSNPFIGLFVGLLATALVQSSSTTTSMIVIMVASGALTLQSAVPMIMGANIGTSVTSTIVAITHIGRRDEFGRAISSATVHDFFNLLVVAILFPIEYFTGALSSMGISLAGIFYSEGVEGTKMFSILGVTVKPVANAIMSFLSQNAILILALSLIMLFFALRGFTVLLKKILIGKSQEKFDKYIFGKPVKSLFWGTVITASVQSSSVTTAIIVPLVATGKITLRKAFPFLMGANVGTTVTALIAAISQTEAALSVAICHLLFNLIGVLMLFPIKSIRNIPIWLSETLGKMVVRRKMVGFVYVVSVFFLIPFILIYSSSSDLFDSKVSDKNPNEIEIREASMPNVETVHKISI